MRTLHIDIETYSSVDIKKSGLYKYVQSPDFEILLFAYAYDDESVQIVDIAAGEKIPYFTLMDLHRPEVIKKAHNAAFEYYCLQKFFETDIRQWRCTMVHSYYIGLPGSLKGVGEVLGLESDKKKLATGDALIRYFCKPCKPTKTNGGRLRNLYKHDLKKWNLFKEYCVQDVVSERAIDKILAGYPYPGQEQQLWIVDQKISIRGVKVDQELIEGSIAISDQMTEELSTEAAAITGIDNPNSLPQLKAWIESRMGKEIKSLDKEAVTQLLKEDIPDDVRRVLELRRQMGKTSVSKYTSMQTVACADNRARGILQFYGANRTGRWAGRSIQPQNMPKNHMESLDTARSLVKKKNTAGIKMIFGNVPDTLSQLIRTTLIPEEGHYFGVADFSAIEARVIAWLAGEDWRLEVFRTHGKIYEASASAMFGVPIEKISKGNPEYELRSKGKVAELALGYQGAAGALIQMGALRMGLLEEDLPDIVRRWRAANRRIVDLWYTIENHAVECVDYGVISSLPCGITFSRDQNYLIVTLPSGRALYYREPQLRPNDWGKTSIWFKGVNQTSGKWEDTPTYGGKLTENIVQAIARDCLANAIMGLDAAGYKINFHVHDEVVMEIPKESSQSLDAAIEIMCRVPAWATGLPLNADGFTGEYYKKE